MQWAESAGDHFQLDTTQAWWAAVCLFGFGDLVTTSIGLRLSGVSEANPIAALFFQHSLIVGMIALKMTAFVVFYALWKAMPRPQRAGIPFGLAFFGFVVTMWNSHIVLLAIL